MAESNVLDFTGIEERLLPYSGAQQVDDGTIFHYQYHDINGSRKQRLFVKYQGKEIDAVLPQFNYQLYARTEAHGNVLYLLVQRKMYTFVFSPPNIITVSKLVGEKSENAQRYSRSSEHWGGEDRGDGKGYICRWWEKKGREISIPQELQDRFKLKWSDLLSIHREKQIYQIGGDVEVDTPMVHVHNEDIIVIQMPKYDGPPKTAQSTHIRETCRFIYWTRGRHLFTLDTDTWEFLPVLTFEGLIVGYIVGVFNGVITVHETRCSSWYSARLPKGYFEYRDEATREMVERIEKFEAAEKERSELVKRKRSQ